MEKSKSFTELIAWQKAHQLTLDNYEATKNFPKEEVYGITSQVRRASVSIAANIAEGYKRRTQKNKARFFNISEGSLDEVKYSLVLVKDLGFIEESKQLIKLADEVGKPLYSYKKTTLSSDPSILDTKK